MEAVLCAKPQFDGCFALHRRQFDPAHGKVVFSWLASTTRDTTDVTIETAEFAEEPFSLCVAEVIRAIKFEPTPTRTRFPMKF